MNKDNNQFTIKWTQSWPSEQWILNAIEAIVESKLENNDFKEAKEILDKISKK